MNENAKCIVLMPVLTNVEVATEGLLLELKDRGYAVRKRYGSIYPDRVRSLMATQALKEGYEEIIWIDSDMVFNPDDVDKLRSHNLPLVCGLYPFKSNRGGIAATMVTGCKGLVFGRDGGLTEIRWAATGFFYTKREVYDRIERKFDLPLCEDENDGDILPYFYPMILHDGERYNYMGEDLSFCERARQSGYKIYADTTIRLGHIGKYRYSWEDITGDRPRAKSFEVDFIKE